MDAHCQQLLDDFARKRSSYETLRTVAEEILRGLIADSALYVVAFESRVKTEPSLSGKLERKGGKYKSILDITDLVGLRVVTFYYDEVDKVAALVERTFCVDWANTVDKRKIETTDRFGYSSLHYICTIPQEAYHDEAHPELNEIPFEIQIRTALQHVWATADHDTGYKSEVEMPKALRRKLVCLAGLMELGDQEFLSLRRALDSYRRTVSDLIRDGRLEEIQLDKESFTRYLSAQPFRAINVRIASINHAEVTQANELPYLQILHDLGVHTLAEVEQMKNDCAEDAFQLARYQLGNTDLDIVASTVGIQSVCLVHILRTGGRAKEIAALFDTLNGPSKYHMARAERIVSDAIKLNLIAE